MFILFFVSFPTETQSAIGILRYIATPLWRARRWRWRNVRGVRSATTKWTDSLQGNTQRRQLGYQPEQLPAAVGADAARQCTPPADAVSGALQWGKETEAVAIYHRSAAARGGGAACRISKESKVKAGTTKRTNRQCGALHKAKTKQLAMLWFGQYQLALVPLSLCLPLSLPLWQIPEPVANHICFFFSNQTAGSTTKQPKKLENNNWNPEKTTVYNWSSLYICIYLCVTIEWNHFTFHQVNPTQCGAFFICLSSKRNRNLCGAFKHA